jgi:hypothetical protein
MAEPRSTRCAGCAKTNQQAADRWRNRREANAWENSQAWRKCSQKLRRDNPICQRIHFGIRCTKPSVLVHHLFDPIAHPDKRTNPRYLVALCRECHPNTAGDLGVGQYAPTANNIMGVRTEYVHTTTAEAQPAPGSIAEALAWIQCR